MRQASLKFKSYVGNASIVDNNDLQGRIFQMMMISFGALALFYVFILGNMVFNIIERRTLEKQAVSLSNQVGDLELSYLSLSNKVNLDLSYSLGFKEVKPTFTVRKSLGFLPTLKTNLANEI